MDKVQILITCRACGGKAFFPTDEEMSVARRKYFRHLPCTTCQGSGKEAHWIDLQDFARMLTAIAVEKKSA